jgi:hypothetical protein
VSITL